ncbi:uncharacterized protein G2W53_021459 [Senna tora]|uniref:Uncharacterized protein n=1 Tax=Senna tora TaxID=362788 RepID=A0A834TLW5_9FABA|nr:uncharacterized protein G2W53_021459 [Senna tora]
MENEEESNFSGHLERFEEVEDLRFLNDGFHA